MDQRFTAVDGEKILGGGGRLQVLWNLLRIWLWRQKRGLWGNRSGSVSTSSERLFGFGISALASWRNATVLRAQTAGTCRPLPHLRLHLRATPARCPEC